MQNSNRNVNTVMLLQLFGLWCLHATSGVIGLDYDFLDHNSPFKERGRGEGGKKEKRKKVLPHLREVLIINLKM